MIGFGQTMEGDTLIDQRDHQKYATVLIGDRIWFRDYLKYETKGSHCPNFNRKDRDYVSGNFYPYPELDEVCPQDWRVATVEDWEAYIMQLRTEKNITEDDIHLDTLMPQEGGVKIEEGAIIIEDTSERLSLFAETNPLHLSLLGWVQGRKRQ